MNFPPGPLTYVQFQRYEEVILLLEEQIATLSALTKTMKRLGSPFDKIPIEVPLALIKGSDKNNRVLELLKNMLKLTIEALPSARREAVSALLLHDLEKIDNQFSSTTHVRS